jgi:hypothetical protein
MTHYTVKFTRIAEAQFDKLADKARIKVAKSIDELIVNPDPKGYKKLNCTPKRYVSEDKMNKSIITNFKLNQIIKTSKSH